MLFLKKHAWWMLSIVIGVCISAGILVHRSKDAWDSRMHTDGVSLSLPEAAESSKGSLNVSTPKKVRKATEPKTTNDHGHLHLVRPSENTIGYPTLSSEQRKRLKDVRNYIEIPPGKDGSPGRVLPNENYFQEVYDAVCEGISTEECIKLLVENRIYTDVILPHMDSYQAFKYLHWGAHHPNAVSLRLDYAKCVIAADPASPEALEVGLYMARVVRDPHERETYYRGVLKYHPGSDEVLYRLGGLLALDRPMEAIPYLKKVDAHSKLGVAYSRLGDYKTAWVHFRIASETGTGYVRSGALRSLHAIESGKPLLSPIARDPDVPAPIIEEGLLKDGYVPFLDESSYGAMPVLPEVPPVDSASESSQVSAAARAAAARQAFSELQEKSAAQQRRDHELWEKELNAFLEWAASVVNESNRQSPLHPEDRFVKDFEDFLAKELERHLRLEKTRFAPDRLSRGFEYIHRYGQMEGLKRLEKKDPELAKEVVRVLTENGSPRGLEK